MVCTVSLYNAMQDAIFNLLSLQLFECTVPQPLGMLEAFVYEEEEYPVVCFGVKET